MKLSKRFSEVVALDFDLACTARLQIYDMEREERMMEMMAGASIAKAFSVPKKPMKEGTF